MVATPLLSVVPVTGVVARPAPLTGPVSVTVVAGTGFVSASSTCTVIAAAKLVPTVVDCPPPPVIDTVAGAPAVLVSAKLAGGEPLSPGGRASIEPVTV